MIEMAVGLLNLVCVFVDIFKVLAVWVIEVLVGELDGVVIIVLVYFDDVQCQGIKDAVCLVGFYVLCLFNELIAAVIVYGLDFGQEGVIVVYDFGGGMFDIFILCLSCGVFEVLVIGGDFVFGGDDFDYLLVDYICEQVGIFDCSDNCVQCELLDVVIAVKIVLSDVDFVIVNVVGWQGEISCE